MLLEGQKMVIDSAFFHRLRDLNEKLPEACYKIEIARANAEPQSPVIDGMPHSVGGFHSKTESGAITLAELEEVYIEMLRDHMAMINALERMIDKLQEPDEKGILRLRYIKRCKLTDIGVILGGELHPVDARQVTRYLRKAESHIIELSEAEK